MRKILFFLLFVLPLETFPQIRLTNVEFEEIEKRTLSKVEEFQQYISDIVNTSLSSHSRKGSLEAALSLFIGKGGEYATTNGYGAKMYKKPVKVCLLRKDSINSIIRSMPIKRFLSNIYNYPFKYGEIKVQSIDIPQIDSLYENNGYYQAKIHYVNKNSLNGSIKEGHNTPYHCFFIPVSVIELPKGERIYDIGLGNVYICVSRY